MNSEFKCYHWVQTRAIPEDLCVSALADQGTLCLWHFPSSGSSPTSCRSQQAPAHHSKDLGFSCRFMGRYKWAQMEDNSSQNLIERVYNPTYRCR